MYNIIMIENNELREIQILDTMNKEMYGMWMKKTFRSLARSELNQSLEDW